MLLKIKYVLIIFYSLLTAHSVVNWFGSTYVVYGNVVKKVGDY